MSEGRNEYKVHGKFKYGKTVNFNIISFKLLKWMSHKIWENSNKLLAFNLEHEFLWKFQKTDDNNEGFISSIDGEKTDSMSISEIFAKMDNAEVVCYF